MALPLGPGGGHRPPWIVDGATMRSQFSAARFPAINWQEQIRRRAVLVAWPRIPDLMQ
jgi:hypothetical protein